MYVCINQMHFSVEQVIFYLYLLLYIISCNIGFIFMYMYVIFIISIDESLVLCTDLSEMNVRSNEWDWDF